MLKTITLDCDEVLYDCISYGLRLVNADYGIDAVKDWYDLGEKTQELVELFASKDFYKFEPIYKGSQEFVSRLSQIADIYIATALPEEYKEIRLERIKKDFPEIKLENIFFMEDKSSVNTMFFVDDAVHNVKACKAKYPILMQRPWNKNEKDFIKVKSYNEILKLVSVFE